MNAHHPINTDEVPVACFMYEIPSFVESELIRLYETLHSSLAFFRIYRSLDRANCYVAGSHGQPRTILLFTCNGRQVDVLNEMIEIEQAELQRFVRYIFTRFAEIDVVSFKALKTAGSQFGLPLQRHASKSTYLITLPATGEGYTASIGKSTRAGLRHQMNNVVRDFATFESKFFVNHEVREDDVRAIVRFSEERIGVKGVRFKHNVDRIMALARRCGFISVFLIDGRICAGSINYSVGTSYFGDVTGYDPRYEKYGLGKLCVHQTICESIRRGARRFYLGGGAFDFKKRMLGVPVCMDELTIYRSRPRMMLSPVKVMRAAMAARIASAKTMMHHHKEKPWAKYAFKSFHFFKNRMSK